MKAAVHSRCSLSRPCSKQGMRPLEEEAEIFVNSITKMSLPATEQRMNVYRQAQEQDPVCAQIREFCKSGWPERKQLVSEELIPYWKVKDSLTTCDQLLFYNSRIVVPKALQKETLQRIHMGHLGIEKCKKRTSSSVWWPGVMQQVAQVVQNCQECAKQTKPGKKPLVSTVFPKFPWQVVGTDLFELNKNNYLLVVDYFSCYPKVVKLTSTTSTTIVLILKSIFARHGIPEVLRSDNGPQYASAEFMTFASSYGFQHITSSSKLPQSNWQAEQCVQIVKNLLKSSDPCLALLSYCSTPLS